MRPRRRKGVSMRGIDWGAWAFKWRGGLWTLFFVLLFPFAHPTVLRVGLGLPLVVAAQAYRFWAVGCIRRYRGEAVGAQQLTTWGPYALSRNPLYLANGVMGLGWALMVGWWALLPYAVFFWVLYALLIIPHEEGFLRQKFGQAYEDFCRDVPALFPNLRRLGCCGGPYDSSVLWNSERHSLWVTVLVTGLLISRLGW